MALLQQVQEELLDRLGQVGVTARHAVESVLAGQHRGMRRGLSVEFAGHRPYQAGDDLRHLDWRVYARTDRYDVQVYEEETRLRATIVLDCSGSMAYSSASSAPQSAASDAGSKLAYARLLAASLAFVMVRQGDAVGLATVDHAVREQLPPAATPGHLLRMLEVLEHSGAGGDTDLSTALDALAPRFQRRGLVVVITDGFDDPQRLVRALRHLRFQRQDVRVFQIVDPDEVSFPLHGSHRLDGLEGEAGLTIDADRMRQHYVQAWREHQQRLAAGCHGADIALHTIATDQDLALALVAACQGVQQHPARS